MVIAEEDGSDIAVEYVRDLSQSHDVTEVPFYATEGYRGIVILVDPRWSDPTFEPIMAKVKVWVEDPCGPITGTVVTVTSTEGLLAACATAASGSTIRLAAGSYYPPLQDLVFGPYDMWGCLLVNNFTLVGAGPRETTITLADSGPHAEFACIWTYGSAKIRDLTIEGTESSIIEGLGNLELCNVEVIAEHIDSTALEFYPWDSGGYSLTVKDCVFTGSKYSDGIYLDSGGNPAGVSITAEITDSRFAGWDTAINYDNDPAGCEHGPINVTVDCDGFSNNEEYNVLECTCVPDSCIERCPNK